MTKFAQQLYLQDQTHLRRPRALSGDQWRVFVLETMQRICDNLRDGVPFDVMVRFVDKNLAVTDAQEFVGNAAGYLCPDYLD